VKYHPGQESTERRKQKNKEEVNLGTFGRLSTGSSIKKKKITESYYPGLSRPALTKRNSGAGRFFIFFEINCNKKTVNIREYSLA
jgi:hypothetical protein